VGEDLVGGVEHPTEALATAGLHRRVAQTIGREGSITVRT
jgi:hypothetical protein